jgi:hypothetical protein
MSFRILRHSIPIDGQWHRTPAHVFAGDITAAIGPNTPPEHVDVYAVRADSWDLNDRGMEPYRNTYFAIVGTGQPLPYPLQPGMHKATIVDPVGAGGVWHVLRWGSVPQPGGVEGAPVAQ